MFLQGKFVITHKRGDIVLSKEDFHNDIVNVGLDQILNVMFGSASKDPAYYIGLIDNAGFSLLSDTDILSSHAGWAEANPYVGDRTIWSPDNAVSGTITNSTVRIFTITATAAIKGIFVCN